MEIILSNQCKSITGSIGRGFGYHIQRRKNGFFAKRNSKGIVPPSGHWRFILACAELAQNRLHISDIKVAAWELADALHEASIFIAERQVRANIDRAKDLYDARDILNLKTTFGL